MSAIRLWYAMKKTSASKWHDSSTYEFAFMVIHGDDEFRYSHDRSANECIITVSHKEDECG